MFTVLAGDFSAIQLRRKKLLVRRRGFSLRLSSWEKVSLAEVASLDVATEESTKRFGRAAVAALAGGLLLGGAGLVAGAFVGGNKKTVTFELRLADGRGVLATCASQVFQRLRAATFKAA